MTGPGGADLGFAVAAFAQAPLTNLPAARAPSAWPFLLAPARFHDLTQRVRFGGWGLDNPLPKAVGIDRNDAAKPTQKAGEAAAHVQAVPHGVRPKAVAADFWQLINSPSTGRTSCHASFRETDPVVDPSACPGVRAEAFPASAALTLLDNITHLPGDDLKRTLTPGAKLRLAASCFSIYAFEALKAEPEQVESVELIFTSPIREGVAKSFGVMAEHFVEQYGKRARWFIYHSKQLHQLESFSSDAGINVMIINVQAFATRGEDARRIYLELDDFQSRKPIDVIRKNRPILILDEPQKMEGKATVEKLKEFDPLMILRYSATHHGAHLEAVAAQGSSSDRGGGISIY